jgi:hypothetical protein
VSGVNLFVLNLRMGWLQVDVFDRGGTLLARLSEADSSYSQHFFPQDIAVRHRFGEEFDIVVAFTRPVPRVALYRARVRPRQDDPAGSFDIRVPSADLSR